MSSKPDPIVVQDPMNPMPVEVVATAITDIAEAVRTWGKSRVKRRVLELLIRDETGLNLSVIQSVLNSIESLDTKFLNGKKG